MLFLFTYQANESHVPLRLEYANCSWVEYDVGDMLQITLGIDCSHTLPQGTQYISRYATVLGQLVML